MTVHSYRLVPCANVETWADVERRMNELGGQGYRLVSTCTGQGVGSPVMVFERSGPAPDPSGDGRL